MKSLCPCSKEISDYGAHNQRSHVTIRVELLDDISWRELCRFAEDAASSEIWSSLKRADEKWITERAYENPKFVEDMVRDVAIALNADASASAATASTSRTSSPSTRTARWRGSSVSSGRPAGRRPGFFGSVGLESSSLSGTNGPCMRRAHPALARQANRRSGCG